MTALGDPRNAADELRAALLALVHDPNASLPNATVTRVQRVVDAIVALAGRDAAPKNRRPN